ncbi:MAG: hypothetical protein KAH54_02180 [Candidatus Sabulitectum sp.]|nr:hypothetical protein [Candidatus Sabulitectum sp.]
MVPKYVFVAIFFAVSLFAGSAFTEDVELWAEIDRINGIFQNGDQIDSDAIEELFQETVGVALSMELSRQFEDLRNDAFETDDFTECDGYADRAGPAINVFIMGESNAIGVNTAVFLDLSIPESEAYTFFLVCVGGFYVDGESLRSGTAELPAWMERSGSSAQAVYDPVQAEEWLGYWESIRLYLDGDFLFFADETILGIDLGSE